MNQSAIAMLQKSIEFMNKDICTELMPEMIPSLLTVRIDKKRFVVILSDSMKRIYDSSLSLIRFGIFILRI